MAGGWGLVAGRGAGVQGRTQAVNETFHSLGNLREKKMTTKRDDYSSIGLYDWGIIRFDVYTILQSNESFIRHWRRMTLPVLPGTQHYSSTVDERNFIILRKNLGGPQQGYKLEFLRSYVAVFYSPRSRLIYSYLRTSYVSFLFLPGWGIRFVPATFVNNFSVLFLLLAV